MDINFLLDAIQDSLEMEFVYYDPVLDLITVAGGIGLDFDPSENCFYPFDDLDFRMFYRPLRLGEL